MKLNKNRYESVLVAANSIEMALRTVDATGTAEASPRFGGRLLSEESIADLFAAKLKLELEKKA